jgi:hypothetical protein
MTDDDSDDIDWRKILYAYVEHVATEEGVDYLITLHPRSAPRYTGLLPNGAAQRRTGAVC